MTCEVANAGAHEEDALGSLANVGRLQPFEAVIIGPMETKAFDVFEQAIGDGRERSFQLVLRHIQGEIFDISLGILQSLKENLDFPKIAEDY